MTAQIRLLSTTLLTQVRAQESNFHRAAQLNLGGLVFI
jgi:hypothetical protein